jgi:hypothetical protein
MTDESRAPYAVQAWHGLQRGLILDEIRKNPHFFSFYYTRARRGELKINISTIDISYYV